MSSLFDKLSTLLNAQIHEVLGNNPSSLRARARLNPDDAAKDPTRSAQALRQRLEEAIAYEDTIQAKVDGLMQAAVALDDEVDGLLRAGKDIEARQLQARLNAKQRQLTIAESELREHRLLTRHLMQELSSLEASLGQTGQAPPRRTSIPVDGAEAPARRYEKFDIVDEAPDPRPPKPQNHDKREMKRRLSRLSKPAADEQ